jgi:carbamoyltransferase
MYVIGISAYYHDSSVCLFKKGQLVFACEEEKFTGIKHDNRFPVNALKYIFDKYHIKRNEIESVCFYENPQLKSDRVNNTFFKNFLECPVEVSKNFIKTKINHWKLRRELKKISDNVFFSNHHDSHIFYSYYSSPFNDAVILSVDGVGEWETMSVGYINKGEFKIVPLCVYPHSVGLFYSAMTSFIGFKPNEGEYKLMGLAPYGNPEKYRDKINQLIAHNCASLKTNMVYFSWDRDCLMFNEELIELMGIENRLPEEPITQDHMDIAATVQEKYESILFEVLRDIQLFTDSTNLALGGGCAYNGTANGKILDNTDFKRLWIPPAPSDAGSCIGACLNYFHTKKRPIRIHTDAFLGPDYTEVDILKVLNKTTGINFRKYQLTTNLNRRVSEEIMSGKVVGWFQGNIEFGARALGNRSILANPTLPNMKDKINKVIKKREGFRPFAPMVTFEDQKKYFEYSGFVPYMNQVVKVKEKYRDKLPSITHVDGTARIQSVTPFNPIYRLLKEYENYSGYPILLNTSFNVKDKTMVLTPQDAMDTFLDTEMDILVMGNYLIRKV